MSRNKISVLVMMLLIGTTFSTIGLADGNTWTLTDPNGEGIQTNPSTFALWDLQFQYDVGGDSGSVYLAGVGFDGTYFYCPEFNSGTIYRFNITGVYIDSFTIPGVSSLVDMAYDGTYMYGVTTSGFTIYQMNMTTQTVAGTISIPSASYNIAYDEDADGGNGGFWIGQWDSHLTLVDRSGTVLDSITPPESMLGLAWDNTSETPGFNGPFLWIYTGTSTGVDGIIKQIDLDTKTLTGVQHNVAQDLGAGIAGGLIFTTDYVEGFATLIGLTQGADPIDDYIFGYEICETGPLPQNIMFIDLEQKWNIVSLPFNVSIPKSNITVNYLGTNYTWADAVTAGYVSDFVYEWVRSSQIYTLATDLHPGDGYWLYAYAACDLWVDNITIVPDELVTNVEDKWNIISVPNLMDVNKTDLTVNYMGTDYTWADAVTGGYVSDFVYGWNRPGQYYSLTVDYEPGEGYWLYSYVDCVLKQPI